MLEERIDIENWIDYWIGLELFELADNVFHNAILYSGADKKRFSLFFYDLDLSLDSGSNASFIDVMHTLNLNVRFWEKFTSEYKDYIINRYAQLRKSILNIENIKSIYTSYVSGIDKDIIRNEEQKWGGEPISGFRNVLDYIEKRLNYLDKNYFNL